MEFLSTGWRRFSCRYWPDRSELRAVGGSVWRLPLLVYSELRRVGQCFPPDNILLYKVKQSIRHQTYIISSVHRSATLQQQIYGWYWGEVTDWISPNWGGVSTTGQVERTGASSPLRSHFYELVHRLLHVVHLKHKSTLWRPGQY